MGAPLHAQRDRLVRLAVRLWPAEHVCRRREVGGHARGVGGVRAGEQRAEGEEDGAHAACARPGIPIPQQVHADRAAAWVYVGMVRDGTVHDELRRHVRPLAAAASWTETESAPDPPVLPRRPFGALDERSPRVEARLVLGESGDAAAGAMPVKVHELRKEGAREVAGDARRRAHVHSRGPPRRRLQELDRLHRLAERGGASRAQRTPRTGRGP
mmetsp:Transcript_48124/g.157525  ORF Transcript_48124/g.157525 Transcript_48124/m.157525 type:complete len:214 (+) Transcript_48124:201-842(+)